MDGIQSPFVLVQIGNIVADVISVNLETFELKYRCFRDTNQSREFVLIVFSPPLYNFQEINVQNVIFRDTRVIDDWKEYTVSLCASSFVLHNQMIVKDTVTELISAAMQAETYFKERLHVPKKEFTKDYYSQKEEWLVEYANPKLIEVMEGVFGFEWAMVLNDRKCIQMATKDAIEKFIAKTMRLVLGKAKQKPIVSRIYIGNEFCAFLLPTPKEINKIVPLLWEMGYQVTFCLPAVMEKQLEFVFSCLLTLENLCIDNDKRIELVFNDWGTAYETKKKYVSFDLCMGRLLNRSKRDPRIQGKLGFESHQEIYGRNNLELDDYSLWLRRLGVNRCETDDIFLSQKTRENISFHFPEYQISTAQNCNLYAECANQGRIHKRRIDICPRYCNEFCFVYPKEYKMVGIGNTCFGFSSEFFMKQNMFQFCIDNSISRFVINIV